VVKPRLIRPIRVEIAKFPFGEEEQDEVWRTPIRDTDAILDDPDTPRVVVKAQVKFGSFEDLEMVPTGSDESTDGYLIIDEKTQDIHNFKPSDHVIRLLARGKKPVCTRLRITQVKPAAQRETFGLVRLNFKDDSRGHA
jgi:hypothetical protein